MDVDEALFVDQLQRVGQRLREGIAVQHHGGTPRAHAFDLDLRRGARHDDGRFDPQLTRRQRQALSMIARRCRHYAPCGLLRGQLRELVVRTTNLEREHRLQIFALEQHLIAQPFGQLASALQRRFDGNVVDARGEDFARVVVEQSVRILAHRIASSYVVPGYLANARGRSIIRSRAARRAIERGMAIMSDS